MTNEEMENLLRRACPPELPHGLKHRVLHAAKQDAESVTLLPRAAWVALATCWAVIVLLRMSMPDVPRGNPSFDLEAFLARSAAVKCIIATGLLPEEHKEEPPPPPVPIESIFRKPTAHDPNKPLQMFS